MQKILGLLIALQASAAIGQSSDRPKFEDTGKYAGKYLCTPLAAGGVQWNDPVHEWRGTAFKVSNDEQFIFEIRASNESEEWKSFGWSVAGTAYFGTVRPIEGIELPLLESTARSCWGEREGYQPAKRVGYGDIFMSPEGKFRCRTSGGLYFYDFNLSARRYQRTYHAGFVDGDDSGGNTPSVEIGECTHIE
ncbi:hypothetical protein [Oricola nitratireducens]|uniref:hypothetical protein n=1 Tax=Oricola nitratireducens TaxID=2775868 RepID=UPI001867D91C|nr:hypothetical protein [Oricola nitratireducens]